MPRRTSRIERHGASHTHTDIDIDTDTDRNGALQIEEGFNVQRHDLDPV